MQIQENVRLAPLTTLGVGGAARFFTRAGTPEEVAKAANFARAGNLPVFVLGGGSNLLVSDAGWNGLVVQIGIDQTEFQERPGQVLADIGAGLVWDHFVQQCVSRDLAGVECLSGIPGSVGGTPVQNVGAYGQEVSETIVSLLAFDLVENRVREMQAAECGFRYRASIFNTDQPGRYVILRVRYVLTPGGRPSLRYDDLRNYFAGRDATPSLAQIRGAVLNIRDRKGMLIAPGDPDSKSAGSFFKNPVLSDEQYRDLTKRAHQRGLQVPNYPALSQQRKISAAWLVENSGFKKGYSRGRVGISSKHALAIVNRGGATASDVLALKNEIQSRVEGEWGITLEPEPVFVGF